MADPWIGPHARACYTRKGRHARPITHSLIYLWSGSARLPSNHHAKSLVQSLFIIIFTPLRSCNFMSARDHTRALKSRLLVMRLTMLCKQMSIFTPCSGGSRWVFCSFYRTLFHINPLFMFMNSGRVYSS